MGWRRGGKRREGRGREGEHTSKDRYPLLNKMPMECKVLMEGLRIWVGRKPLPPEFEENDLAVYSKPTDDEIHEDDEDEFNNDHPFTSSIKKGQFPFPICKRTSEYFEIILLMYIWLSRLFVMLSYYHIVVLLCCFCSSV